MNFADDIYIGSPGVDFFGNILEESANKVNPLNDVVMGYVDSFASPKGAFFGAGVSLIVVGSDLTLEGAGIMAAGGPPGLIGGGIVTTVGVTVFGSGVLTIYIGSKIDY